jgi:hypothetical protein
LQEVLELREHDVGARRGIIDANHIERDELVRTETSSLMSISKRAAGRSIL